MFLKEGWNVCRLDGKDRTEPFSKFPLEWRLKEALARPFIPVVDIQLSSGSNLVLLLVVAPCKLGQFVGDDFLGEPYPLLAKKT